MLWLRRAGTLQRFVEFVALVTGASSGIGRAAALAFAQEGANLARLLVDRGADVLVAPSAWVAGERKVDHWRTLVRARAIENTVYVVAAAQPGPRYTGHSLVVDPLGDVLAEAGDGEEAITATLDPEVVARARETNPSLANRRM